MKSTALLLVPILAGLAAEASAQAPGARGVALTVTGTLPPQTRENPGAASPTDFYVFGGAAGNAGSARTNGLYSFDPVTLVWTEHNANGAAGAPPARSQCGVCWDDTRKRLIVFGGHDGTARRNDTWEFNPVSGTWTDITPSSGNPSARQFTSIAHDPASGNVILFGGLDASGHLNDTWMLIGGAVWSQLSPTNVPATRRQHHLETRTDFGDIILCGGQDLTLPKPGRFRTGVWRFTGLDWQQLTITGTPAATVANESAYDPIRKRLVLMGGNGITAGSPTGVVSEFDCVSNTWENRFGVATPDPVVGQISRYFAAFVASGGAIYKTLGQSPRAAGNWRDTVLYQSEKVASSKVATPGCAGTSGVPELSAPGLAWQGRNLELEVKNSPAGATVLMGVGFTAINVPLSLLGIGPANCVLTVDPFFVFPTAPNGAGNPSLSIPVPNIPAVLTAPPMMTQALAITGGTAVISNRLDVTGGAL